MFVAGVALAQLVGVEPAHEEAALVDGVGQLEVARAIVEVLAAHRDDHVAARVRAEEVVEQAVVVLDELGRDAELAIGLGVKIVPVDNIKTIPTTG